jgi:UrcA family protein
MTVNIIRTSFYAAIGVLFGSAAVWAPWTSAQASEEPVVTKTVKFADLDIHTVEGAKILYRRIQMAAQQVCLPSDGHSMRREPMPQCVNTAIDDAVKKVNAPYLTALRFGNGIVRLASK